MKISPKFDFEKIKTNNYQNLKFRRKPKISEKPRFKKRVQNVLKRKLKFLKFKRNVVSKDFSMEILDQKISFIKISKKEYKILKEKDPLKLIL